MTSVNTKKTHKKWFFRIFKVLAKPHLFTLHTSFSGQWTFQVNNSVCVLILEFTPDAIGKENTSSCKCLHFTHQYNLLTQWKFNSYSLFRSQVTFRWIWHFLLRNHCTNTATGLEIKQVTDLCSIKGTSIFLCVVRCNSVGNLIQRVFSFAILLLICISFFYYCFLSSVCQAAWGFLISRDFS